MSFTIIISILMLFLIIFFTILAVVVKLKQSHKNSNVILCPKKIENKDVHKIISMNNYMSQNLNSDVEEIDDAHLINYNQEDDEVTANVRKGYYFIQNFKEYGDLHSYEPFLDDLNKLIWRKNQNGYELLKIYIKCFNKFSSILEEELPKIISGDLDIDLTNKKILGHLGAVHRAIELVEEGLNYIMEDQHTNFTYNFKLVKNGIDYFFKSAPYIYLIITQKYIKKNINLPKSKLQNLQNINNQILYKKQIDFKKFGNEFFSIMSNN